MIKVLKLRYCYAGLLLLRVIMQLTRIDKILVSIDNKTLISNSLTYVTWKETRFIAIKHEKKSCSRVTKVAVSG